MKISLLPSVFKGSIINSATRLESLARMTGWMKRATRKISPINFVHGVLFAVTKGEPSFRLLATAIGLRLDPPPAGSDFDTVSKQALWERVDSSAVMFFKGVLADLLKSCWFTAVPIPSIPSVGRIIVEDSSKIDLPAKLAKQFPATSNQSGHCGAGLRLQGAFDLATGEPIRLDLTDYHRQDTTAAGDILPLIKRGDLIIRDLGYLVAAVFAQIAALDAFFLSRFKVGRMLHNVGEDGQPGDRIDLIKLLLARTKVSGDSLDIDVVLGSSERGGTPLVCRLVALKLPESVAQKRRRRMRADQKRRGRQISKEVSVLLGWTILITNLPREEVSPQLLAELYKLRWRVEIIFKALKSHTPCKVLANHRSNANHLQVLLYALLCLVVASAKTGVFALIKRSRSGTGMNEANLLSLLKVLPKVFEIFRMALLFSCCRNPLDLLSKWFAQSEYHDRYEHRGERINMAEMASSTLGITGEIQQLHQKFDSLT